MENELILRLNLQFFAKDGPGGEKTEPATSKKLNDVRKEESIRFLEVKNLPQEYVKNIINNKKMINKITSLIITL